MKVSNGNGNSGTTRIGYKRRLGFLGLLLLLAVVMVAACGKNENQAGGAATQTTGEAAEAAAGESTKTVQHIFGETAIPAQPMRIVSIGLEDMLLALDVPLVQANGMEGYYLYDRLQEKNVPLLYAGAGINYEAILAEKPDLILVLSGLVPDQEAYDKISRIAPTLVYDRDEWKTSIVKIGQALGLENQANTVIQAYDEKLAQAHDSIVQAIGTDKTVALIRPSEKDLQLFLPRFAYGSVLYNDLGLSPAAFVTESQNESAEDTSASTLSLEKLPEFDADYLFTTAGGSLSPEIDFKKALEVVTGVEKLQVWQSIPAVKLKHSYKLSARHWMLSGPIADGMKIDDVVAAVTGQGQPSP
ncbi:iron-siderophore ABC transporter substrate-binding protein [Cohnella sp. GCM10012308]|uniref:iron-siderophore ABC transporter substrate-binding protein n=1 Tax=Cohnella sp. GCM10012308 TaxID=3317329 RepID=UPI003615E244